MTRYIATFPASELDKNKSRAIDIEGQSVLVCNAGGNFFAVENRCSHQAAELEGGRIRGCFISCPLHGLRFNLKDGEPMGQLTRTPITTYAVRIVDDVIEVAVE